MKHLKRNWKLFAAVFAVTVTTGTLLWRAQDGSGAATAMIIQQPPAYSPITEVQRSSLMRVLDEIAADRDALIALNVNAAQAESLLAQGRSWFESNQANLASLDQTIAQKTDALREIERLIRMGPAQEGQDQTLMTARQELANSRQARRDALVPLKTALNSILSDTQDATWASVQNGFGQRMPIRMLALTAEQAENYGNAWQRYQLERAADTDQERATAESNWQAAQSAILTPEQQQVMAAYYEYLATSSAAVAQAYDTVLPPAMSGT